jgi:peptide/nickel transport system substrate-binding protein
MTRARLLPALVLAVLAGGCGSKPPATGGGLKNEYRRDGTWVKDDADESKAKAGGSIVLPLLNDPDSFNPYLSTYADVDDVLRLVFPTLMHEHPDFEKGPPDFTPFAAESWEIAKDRSTITFHLRKDMNWSDGVPLTAEDVRYSWQTAKDKDVAWVNNSIKDFIDDVKVVDDKTVVLHYTEASPYQVMDANDGYIIPKHVFSKIPYADWKTHPSWTAEAGVSAGPYRVVEFTSQERVVLEANPTYYRKGFPRIPRVTFRVIKKQEAQRDALLSGGLDVVQTVPALDVKRFVEDGRFHLFNCRSRGFTYVGWNCRRFPVDDPDVRRAMTLAIDRDDLVESLYVGYADVGSSPIISSMWAHDRTMKPLPFDPEEAKKTLEARGWKPGAGGVREKDGKRLSFPILVSSVNDLRIRACTKMQAYVKNVGVEMKIETVEPNTLSERLRKHDFVAEYGAWYVATKVDEKVTWHSSSTGYDGFNWVDYRNPRVDEIIEKARVMTDFAAAKPLWDEFQRIIEKDQPYTFVAEPRQLNVYAKRLRGVLSAAVGPFLNVEEWWIEEPAK